MFLLCLPRHCPACLPTQITEQHLRQPFKMTKACPFTFFLLWHTLSNQWASTHCQSFKRQVSPKKKSLYLHTYLLSWEILKWFLISFMLHLSSKSNSDSVEIDSTFYIIPAFPPSLHPSSIYSITWQESWYFPWDSMSYCPLTTSNSTHALPSLSAFAHCLLTTHNASVHFKSKSCAASLLSLHPRFSSGFSSPCVFPGHGGCCSFTKNYSLTVSISTILCVLTLCLNRHLMYLHHVKKKMKGGNRGCVDE